MSELATAYYQERAAAASCELPDILNGQPVLLLAPPLFVPVHNAKKSPVTTVAGSVLYTALHGAQDFLYNTLPSGYQADHFYDPGITWSHNRKFSQQAVARLLLPNKKLPTGKLSDVCVEAIAREEVDDSDLFPLRDRLSGGAVLFEGEENENVEAYFELSGEIVTGSRTLSVRGLALIHMVQPKTSAGIAPAYHGRPLGQNKKMAKSVHRDINATSRFATARASGAGYIKRTPTVKARY
ncbi:MAG TPA: hypothetical protein VJR27_00105 [Candidatus Saccharimonadales bacterium]|nr:hypothetical protein [Candidatus Saccharimonadales bacterium]